MAKLWLWFMFAVANENRVVVAASVNDKQLTDVYLFLGELRGVGLRVPCEIVMKSCDWIWITSNSSGESQVSVDSWYGESGWSTSCRHPQNSPWNSWSPMHQPVFSHIQPDNQIYSHTANKNDPNVSLSDTEPLHRRVQPDGSCQMAPGKWWSKPRQLMMFLVLPWWFVDESLVVLPMAWAAEGSSWTLQGDLFL